MPRSSSRARQGRSRRTRRGAATPRRRRPRDAPPHSSRAPPRAGSLPSRRRRSRGSRCCRPSRRPPPPVRERPGRRGQAPTQQARRRCRPGRRRRGRARVKIKAPPGPQPPLITVRSELDLLMVYLACEDCSTAGIPGMLRAYLIATKGGRTLGSALALSRPKRLFCAPRDQCVGGWVHL